WLAAFDAVVPPLLRQFRPTVLVTQDGCDTHALDPLAHLLGSTAMWPHVGRRFHELAHELCGGRWVATGGGGYAIREVVPRAWTLLFAEMVERPELASALVDTKRYAPEQTARERVWALLDRDLGSLARELGQPLSLYWARRRAAAPFRRSPRGGAERRVSRSRRAPARPGPQSDGPGAPRVLRPPPAPPPARRHGPAPGGERGTPREARGAAGCW